MNKLKTTDTGGFPYVLDDIRWEQDAYRNSFAALVKAIRNSATQDSILWGCEVTDNTTNFDVAAGAVVIDGEIHLVDAVTNKTKAASHTLYIAASTGTYDAAGLKTFQDANTHDTYEIRKAVTSIGIVPGGQISLSTTGAAAIPLKIDYSYHNFMGKVITTIQLADTSIDDTGTYETANNIQAATSGFTYWKRGNMIEFKGGFGQDPATSVTSRYKVGTMPSGYRPQHPVLVNGYAYANSGTEWVPIEFDTDGSIYVRGDIRNTIYGSGATFNTTTGIVVNGSFTNI